MQVKRDVEARYQSHYQLTVIAMIGLKERCTSCICFLVSTAIGHFKWNALQIKTAKDEHGKNLSFAPFRDSHDLYSLHS